MLLREETAKVLHTKSNGDKLVASASGDGYTAFTKDDVHIGHISAETDPAAIAEFSKKEPKYEAIDMSLEDLQRTADRYLDVEIVELMRTILEKTSSMNREQLSRLVRWCRNFYALLEEFVSDDLTEGYMDAHDGMNHVDTLDMMAALKAVVREYGHMELVTPIRCEMRDDEHGRRLALVPTTNEGLIPDKIVPDKIGGDIILNLDGSHSSVGFLGGTATTTNNGEEGNHEATNSHKEDLDEAMSNSALSNIFGVLGDTYGKIMLKSDQADKILEACGQEPTGKDATFDEVLSVVQDVIAGAPLAATAVVALLEAVFDVLLALATAGLIALPLDGPVGEVITSILAAIPVAAVVGAIVAAPAALANRLVLLARKALRNKNDVDRVEKAAQQVAVKKEPVDESIAGLGLAALSPVIAASRTASSPRNSRGNFAGNTINFNFSGNNARWDPHTDFSGNSNDMSGNSARVDAKVAEVSPEVAAQVNPEVTASVPVDFDADGASVGVLGGQAGAGGTLHNKTNDDMTNEDIHDDVMPQYCADEYDDDFDDLSSFNECSEVKRADALYGVRERDDLVEAVYTDTNGIMGIAGETYTTDELRKIWNDSHNDDPSMAKYNGDYDRWVSDTLAQMSRNDDVDEAFDMSYGPDLGKLSWQVSSFLDVDALGEDKWIEFICDDPRDVVGGTKTMRFEAIGENDHKYGFIRTNGDAVDVQFRNGSEAMCHSAEEVARFIAGEFGISL